MDIKDYICAHCGQKIMDKRISGYNSIKSNPYKDRYGSFALTYLQNDCNVRKAARIEKVNRVSIQRALKKLDIPIDNTRGNKKDKFVISFKEEMMAVLTKLIGEQNNEKEEI